MTEMHPGEGGAGGPSGWFYVGDGRLRYRDEHGWTEYYMDTRDPRALSWPPVPPRELLQELHDDLHPDAARATGGAATTTTTTARHRFAHLSLRRRNHR